MNSENGNSLSPSFSFASFFSAFWQLANWDKKEQECSLPADTDHEGHSPSGAPPLPILTGHCAAHSTGEDEGRSGTMEEPYKIPGLHYLPQSTPLSFLLVPHPFSPTPAPLIPHLNVNTCTPFPPLKHTSPVSPSLPQDKPPDHPRCPWHGKQRLHEKPGEIQGRKCFRVSIRGQVLKALAIRSDNPRKKIMIQISKKPSWETDKLKLCFSASGVDIFPMCSQTMPRSRSHAPAPLSGLWEAGWGGRLRGRRSCSSLQRRSLQGCNFPVWHRTDDKPERNTGAVSARD